MSQLLIVERMADEMGVLALAKQCRGDYENNKRLMDEKLWAGTHYLTWFDEESGRKNDDIMAYQLVDVFTNAQAGISEAMYAPERIKIVLDAIWAANVKLGNGFGATNYARADGDYMSDAADGYGKYAIFTQNTIILAMTAIYAGDFDRGLALAETTWRNLVLKQGLGWDMTHIVHSNDGRKVFGSDYNQQSVIWFLPSALAGGDAATPARDGGIIERILKAAKLTG